jgi:hypothetical protein
MSVLNSNRLVRQARWALAVLRVYNCRAKNGSAGNRAIRHSKMIAMEYG